MTALLLLLVALVGPAVGADDANRFAATMQHRGLQGARVGALVVDADSGAEVFARDADGPLIAASNVKVLTAVAALETFGPTHAFVTEVHADRQPDAGGAVGRLVLVGGGDPSLTSEQMWRLAADLAAYGLRRVEGDIVLDASVFDDEAWHPTWGPTSARAYHAPVAGLQVNYGSFTVTVSPGVGAGNPARVFVDPALPYFSIVNRTRTANGRGAKLTVDRAPAGSSAETVTVGGTIGSAAAPQSVPRSVTQPIPYAGHVFAQQLAANGIAVSGALRVGRRGDGDVRLLDFRGKPLSEIVALFMKHSNNNIAESLVKSMGQKAAGGAGSWTSGAAAMRSTLIQLGLQPGSFTLVDGSGLSREDRVSPRALVTALRSGSSSFAYGPELVASLPIANRDGTLKRRADAARDAVRAKTGLLNGATALSGIAQDAGGRRLVFSIIANGYKAGDLEAMAALDAFAAAVAGR